MRYAVYSDTHSNLEALDTFVQYTRDNHIDRYFMLGDIVGYAANPQEVIDKVMKISNIVVMGNHDQAISDDKLLDWFNEDAKKALIWTRKKLTAESVKKLAALPYTCVDGVITLTHSSPDHPERYTYIYDWVTAHKGFQAFSNKICFIGHTHVPMLFSEKESAGCYLEEGTYQLEPDDRYIISCGSIGQPRDNDNRLSFGIFDDQKYSMTLVRLSYPCAETARKINEAGLPKYFADRLL